MTKGKVLEHERNAHKAAQPITRTSRSRFGSKLITSLALASSLLLGTGAKAENKKLAMAPSGQTEKKTETIALSKMQVLDKKTEKYRIKNGTFFDGNKKMFATGISIPLETGGRLIAFANICHTGKCTGPDSPAKELITLNVDEKGNKVVLGAFDLSSLDAVYKEHTGGDIKYVKLVVDKFQSKNPEYGIGIAILVVPVKSINAAIEAGTPSIYTVFYTGVRQVTEEKSKLVSSL